MELEPDDANAAKTQASLSAAEWLDLFAGSEPALPEPNQHSPADDQPLNQPDGHEGTASSPTPDIKTAEPTPDGETTVDEDEAFVVEVPTDETLGAETKPARRASPLRAAALSMVFPGLGHLQTRRRRGLLIASSTLLTVVAVSLWAGTRSRVETTSWLVQPSVLKAAIGVSIVTMVLRALVAVDAVRSADRWATAQRRWLGAAGLAVVAALIVVPHVIAASYLSTQLDLVTTVFTAELTTTARPTPLPETSGSDRATVPDSNPQDPASPSSETSTSIPVPTTAAADARALRTWDGEERLTIALLGGDAGFDRVGVRTDTIIVLSIEIETGKAVAFSIPRNWQAMRFPEGTPAAAAYPDGYDQKANAVYALGTDRPDLFPDSGDPASDAIKQVLAQVLGIPIQYYVLVDMVAVVDTIDLFGGLDLTVTEHISDSIKPIVPGGPSLVIDTEPGEHHFDGSTTLAYVRSRRQSWDYNRMARQRCVVGAMIDQISALDVIRNFRPLSDIISEHVTTDIPLDRSDDLIQIADRLDPQRITTLSFVPPDYPEREIPFARVRADVSRDLAETADEPSTPLVNACG